MNNNALDLVKCLLILCLMLALCPVYGQAENEEEESLESLRKQIEFTDQLLEETKNEQNRTIVELGLLKRKIQLSENLVNRLNKDLRRTDGRISELEALVNSMEDDRKKIILDYAKTAQLTYQTFHEDNFWLSILSANSLIEAYYRGRYFQQFASFRKRAASRLEKAANIQRLKAQSLKDGKVKKEQLLSAKVKEVEDLSAAREKHNALLGQLKGRESKFRRELQAQREELKKLIGELDPDYGISETAGNDKIGTAFEENRGFLSWPVEADRGVIVGLFGETEDVFGNRVVNDGIFVRTPMGEKVSAIFGGRVTGVQRIPPINSYMVIIQHGKFRTVYARLDEVTIKKGDFIKARQEIGVVRTDPRTKETLFQFLIYKVPDVFLDPETWLFPK